MIISHEWLKQFVPHTLSAEQAGELLSRHCVTLDSIEIIGKELEPLVIARVLEARRHPNSDKLWLTRVDDGSGEILDVVCGAQNIVEGTIYPFARTGTRMPAGIVIEKRKIRGETSNGMLCSARELGLGEDHAGILAIVTDAPPGTALLDVLAISDARLELDVLPNRPDLLSHWGVARELSALTGVALSNCPVNDIPGGASTVAAVTGKTAATGKKARIALEDTRNCPHYVGVVIEGVTVRESPEWLARRLAAIGQRSISNVVDATNYVLHGFGQPVHAFDLDKLSGNAIVVRPSAAGEVLVTLDGTSHNIAEGTTVICDAERPVAFAGVMGGLDSEVTAATTRVLLEVAAFDARFVRAVRKATGLSTDASYRFERGTDRAAVTETARLAAALIVRVAGGEVVELLDAGEVPEAQAEVGLRPSRIRTLMGIDVSADVASRHLKSLGLSVRDAGADLLMVSSPSWRLDLGIEADLIEEVGRVIGYDSIPDELRPFRPGNVPDDPLHLRAEAVRGEMVAQGYLETRPMPFTATGSEATPRVRNPLAEDEPYLRASLLDTLSGRVEYNFSRMQRNIRLFEVGHAFEGIAGGGRLPREEMRVAAVMVGDRRPVHFTEPKPPAFDQWDLKALATRVAAIAFAGEAVELVPDARPLPVGTKLWSIRAGGREVGSAVRLKVDRPEWASEVHGFEIGLGVVSSDDVAPPGKQAVGNMAATAAHHAVRYTPLLSTPPAEFDLALLVPDSVAASDVEAEIRRAAGDLLERLELFDEYRGKNLEAGVRSLAWSLTLRHPERTLRDKEIEGRRSRILSELNARLGVRARAT